MYIIDYVLFMSVSVSIIVAALLTVDRIRDQREIETEKITTLYESFNLTFDDYLKIAQNSINADYGYYSELYLFGLILVSLIFILVLYSSFFYKTKEFIIEQITRSKEFKYLVFLYVIHQYLLIRFLDAFFELHLKDLSITLTFCSLGIGLFYVFSRKLILMHKNVQYFKKITRFKNISDEERFYSLLSSKFIRDSVKLELLFKHAEKEKYHGTAAFLFLDDSHFYFESSSYEYKCFRNKIIRDKRFTHFFFHHKKINNYIHNEKFFKNFNYSFLNDPRFKTIFSKYLLDNIECRDFYFENFKLKGCFDYIHENEGNMKETNKNRENIIIVND